MSLEITRMRLEGALSRALQFVDDNLVDFAQDEILIQAQQIGWQEGLSENAIGSMAIEKGEFLKVNLVWNLFGPNDEPLSIFLEDGTIPHDIEAKGKDYGGADYLMWHDNEGKPIFRKKVKHPGTKGKHIMRRGWEAGQSNFQNRIIREVNNRLKVDKIG